MVKWLCEDGKDNIQKIFKRKKDAIAYAEKHPKVMEIHRYIHSHKKEEECEYKGCVWKRNGWDNNSFMPDSILFRGKEIGCGYTCLENDTFSFSMGDGELSDKDGQYFIHFEYHADEDEWVIEIFWDDDSAEIGFEGSEEYITEQEVEYVKEFIGVIGYY